MEHISFHLNDFVHIRFAFHSFSLCIWYRCICEKLVSKIYIFYISSLQISRDHFIYSFTEIESDYTIFQHGKKFVNIHMSQLKAVLFFSNSYVNELSKRSQIEYYSIEQLISQFMNINSYIHTYIQTTEESLFSLSQNLKYYLLHAPVHIKGNVMFGRSIQIGQLKKKIHPHFNEVHS